MSFPAALNLSEITVTSKPFLHIRSKDFLSIKSHTTAPVLLIDSKLPIIDESAILSSTRLTSRAEETLFFTFLVSPLCKKATLSFTLQKTPTFGFSLKSVIRKRDLSFLMAIFPLFYSFSLYLSYLINLKCFGKQELISCYKSYYR